METPGDKVRRPRVSLTKAQRATVAGAELLSLCLTITSDGRVLDEEIQDLRRWLDENRETDLPSRAHLFEVVERILADGHVTPEERKDLQVAIEAVLPPEARTGAVRMRRAIEAREEGRVRASEERVEAPPRVPYADPILELDFMVAGVRYAGRAEVVDSHVRAGEPAYLLREPENRYSKFATAVVVAEGLKVGYVPEELAVEVAPLLDEGCRQRASFKKVLSGGRVPIPVVVAEVFHPRCEVSGAVLQQEIPSRAAAPGGRAGCATLACAVVAIAVGFGLALSAWVG